MDKDKLKEFLKAISIPLGFLVLYAFVMLVWWIFDLPSDKVMIGILEGWFDQYGLWIVFIGALIEGFLLLGQYLPGGFIIFFGVISAGDDIPRAVLTVSIVCLAFSIAYTLNYLVGRYGLYRIFIKFGLQSSFDQSKAKLERRALPAILASYWDPNLASVVATAAGVLRISFGRFSLFSLIGILIWNTWWGTFAFVMGKQLLTSGSFSFILLFFVLWMLVLVVRKYVFKNNIV